MKFKELIKKLNKMNLPIGKYAIFGSGHLSIRKIRDSRDLDIVVTKEIFEKYLKKPDWKLKEFRRDGGHIKMLEKDDIELYPSWGPGEWNVLQIMQEAEIMDGLPFANLKNFIKWKKISGRDKDFKDVELLKKYLEEKEVLEGL